MTSPRRQLGLKGTERTKGTQGPSRMSSLTMYDPEARFPGLAGAYDRYRPTYPDEAVQLIITRGGLGPNSLLVDVGCGTGISSRLFARRGIPVLGIDPNDNMRAQAERVPL